MDDAVSPSENRIMNKGNLRTILELLWLLFFGFIFTMGGWGVVTAILHLLDTALGLVAFSAGLVVLYLALSLVAFLFGGGGLLLLFFGRKIFRRFNKEYLPGSWWDIAYFPPVWFMLVLAVPAFILAVGMWIVNMIVPITFWFVGLPLFVPLPLVIPAIFWIAYGTSLKRTWMVPLMLSLMWGLLSTIPSLFFNTASGSLLGLVLSAKATNFVTTAFVAPLVEETMKPLLILLFLKYIKDERDGFAFGLTMGIGFAVIENFLYILNNNLTWGFLIMLRSYNMVLHAIGPSLIGYFIGKARRKGEKKYYFLIPVGWLVGFLIHMTWNGTTSLSGIIPQTVAALNNAVCVLSALLMLFFPALEWLLVFMIGRRAAKVSETSSQD